MEAERHRQRIARCTSLMRDSGLDVLLLTKPRLVMAAQPGSAEEG